MPGDGPPQGRGGVTLPIQERINVAHKKGRLESASIFDTGYEQDKKRDAGTPGGPNYPEQATPRFAHRLPLDRDLT